MLQIDTSNITPVNDRTAHLSYTDRTRITLETAQEWGRFHSQFHSQLITPIGAHSRTVDSDP